MSGLVPKDECACVAPGFQSLSLAADLPAAPQLGSHCPQVLSLRFKVAASYTVQTASTQVKPRALLAGASGTGGATALEDHK